MLFLIIFATLRGADEDRGFRFLRIAPAGCTAGACRFRIAGVTRFLPAARQRTLLYRQSAQVAARVARAAQRVAHNAHDWRRDRIRFLGLALMPRLDTFDIEMTSAHEAPARCIGTIIFHLLHYAFRHTHDDGREPPAFSRAILALQRTPRVK